MVVDPVIVSLKELLMVTRKDQMNSNVLVVMASVLVYRMWRDCAATLVLPRITGIPWAKDVSNVNAMLLALLVATVMILDIAHVRPTLVGVGVINVLLVIMVL